MNWENVTALQDAGQSVGDLDLATKRTYYGCDGRCMVTLANSRWKTARLIRITDTVRGIRYENLIGNQDIAFWLSHYGVKSESVRWWYEEVKLLYDDELSKADEESSNNKKKDKLVYRDRAKSPWL